MHTEAAPEVSQVDSETMEDQLGGVDLKETDVAQRRKIMLLKGKRTRLERERQELGL